MEPRLEDALEAVARAAAARVANHHAIASAVTACVRAWQDNACKSRRNGRWQ